MSDETTIYVTDGVVITNLRAVFGTKTYAVSNITSVEKKENRSGGCIFLGMIGAGLFLALAGFNRANGIDWPTIIFGFLLMIVGVFVAYTGKTTYIVSLTTADGEVKAFQSTDQQTVTAILRALNDAIIKKG